MIFYFYYILSKEAPTSVDLSCNEYSVKADKGADFIFVAQEFSEHPDENYYFINGKVGLAFNK